MCVYVLGLLASGVYNMDGWMDDVCVRRHESVSVIPLMSFHNIPNKYCMPT